ncbi:MAG TPA: ABC transporter substrate-binding protein [Anaerolineales bacterium]|nr:ABC transporter substrate-binding protein [Anaerolineales bacterium]
MRARSWMTALLVIGLAACARTAPPNEEALTTIRLPMGYIPNVQYAPFYLAVDRGYFADEGLAIDFDYSFETDGVALVGANELFFTLASAEQVLLARAQGLPVVYVLSWWNDFPVAVAAPLDSGIATPADLRGKTVGIPILGGASYIGYRALLSAHNLPEDIASLEVIGFTQVEALLTHQVDAAVVYANNEPIQLEAQGLPVRLMRVAEAVSLASNGLVTNEATLRDQPDLVRRMVAATLRGIEAALEDPEAAFETCKSFVEGLEQSDGDVQRAVLAASMEFWRSDHPGVSDRAAWENMQAVLLDMGLLSAPLDIDRAFTNEYLP